MKSETFGTVSIQLTNPDENLTDLINLLAHLTFTAGIPVHEVLVNTKLILEEQYTQSILNAPSHETD